MILNSLLLLNFDFALNNDILYIERRKEDFEKHTTGFVDRRVEGLFNDVLYKIFRKEFAKEII